MKRRTFIAGLGSAAAWPLAAPAQEAALPALPLIGFVDSGSADASTDRVRAFRKGIGETGFVEGRNVTVEYHWLEGHYDRLPALMAALVRHSLPRCKKRLGQGQTYSPDRDRLSIHP